MEYNKSQWLGKCYLVLVTISQICFALFSQQIPPLRKHLGDMTWSMFTFKVVTLGLSFYLY